jgi:hypothetical protein
MEVDVEKGGTHTNDAITIIPSNIISNAETTSVTNVIETELFSHIGSAEILPEITKEITETALSLTTTKVLTTTTKVLTTTAKVLTTTPKVLTMTTELTLDTVTYILTSTAQERVSITTPKPGRIIPNWITCYPGFDTCASQDFTCCIAPDDLGIEKYTCRAKGRCWDDLREKDNTTEGTRSSSGESKTNGTLPLIRKNY